MGEQRCAVGCRKVKETYSKGKGQENKAKTVVMDEKKCLQWESKDLMSLYANSLLCKYRRKEDGKVLV